MNYSPKALVPGILAGIFVIIFLTGMMPPPVQVNASAPAADAAAEAPVVNPDPQAQEAAAEAEAAGIDLSQEAGGGVNAANTTCSLPGSYPENIRRWCDLIESHAGQHGVDPRLIAALILQESGGKPDAYSHSGAVGLMQVMPRDGIATKFQCPNGPCFANRPSMDELFDPEFNISYGTGMLAGLINKYGNPRDALKAYGPMDMGYRYADIVLGHFNSYQ